MTFAPPGDRLAIQMSLEQDGRAHVRRVAHGVAAPVTNRWLGRMLVRYPLMTAKVTTLIHLQGLRLHRRGVAHVRRPPHPAPGRRRMTATHVEVEARRPLHPDTVAAPTRARIARALFLRAVQALPAGSLTVVLPDGRTAVAGRRRCADDGPVHREDFFHRLGAHSRIGFGEAYMAGDWSADELAAALAAFASSLDRLAPAPFRPRNRPAAAPPTRRTRCLRRTAAAAECWSWTTTRRRHCRRKPRDSVPV